MEGNKLTLKYTCPDGSDVDTTFDCLGDYATGSAYHVVVLKAPTTVADVSTLSFTDTFYWLVFHVTVDVAASSRLWLNPAGNCDSTFIRGVALGIDQQMATLDIQ